MSPTTRFWLRGLWPVLALGVVMVVVAVFPIEGEPDTPGEFASRGAVLLWVNAFIWYCFQLARARGREIADDPDLQRTPWARRIVTAVAVWMAIGLAIFAIFLLLMNADYLLRLVLAFRRGL